MQEGSGRDRPSSRQPARRSRREVIAGGLCLCCLPSLGRAADAFRLDEVASGVFIRSGVHEDATSQNNDAIANIGFIVGRDGVLVTDSGGSLADGLWLRNEIRQRTGKPIRHVVLTHVHPDHCFGAGAFIQDKPAFVGHPNLAAALDGRGEYYRQRLADILGAERAGDVVYPTQAVTTGAEIDLGDRVLRFTAHGVAHTNCDLSMIDSRTGLLFPADLLFVTRVPSLDGSLLGWLKEAGSLSAAGSTRAVPGHGPTIVDLGPALQDLTRYLSALRDETRAAIAAGKTIADALASVARSERGRWALFDDYNPRNVTEAYKELEWE